MSITLLHSAHFQFLLLFCITIIHVTTTASITEKAMDEVALSAFKSKIIHDPQGVFISWNESRHFCQWEGITCSRKHRRVTALELTSRGLYGSLSPSIGNLSFLRELKLQNNSIQGEIPGEFGRLFRLEVLILNNNSLVGEIPGNLSRCSRLQVLILGNNKLVGKIPLQLVSLSNLKSLNLRLNNLTGGIPSFLGNLTSLEVLNLFSNHLGGNIPDSLGQLRNLTLLNLESNNLSGTVPTSLYNLSSLTLLSLAINNLHGWLPPNLGLTLPNLQVLALSQNFFSGSIPVSVSNASELNAIQLSRNNFSGKLSVDFGGMQHLRWVILSKNNLGSGEVDEMNFFNSLVNCSKLFMFSIDNNHFKGALPHSIANLSSTLQILLVGWNRLHGSIPPGIANLVSLSTLGLNDIQLTGPIPEETGKLRNLKKFGFFNNQLSGRIPSSLGNLSELLEIDMHNNKLSGVIPSSLGNLKKLAYLDLSRNDLSGTIPEQIFDLSDISMLLNLSQNHLVGSIPQNIGNLKVISNIDVSDNNVSGEIPNGIGSCSHLEFLNMRGNFFSGSIPTSMSSLRGIREIDFSHNNLTGQIPKFLETLALEKLNLSFNDFDGEVPIKGVFTNASAISVAGNDRVCGGITELRLPKCLGNDSKKKTLPLVIIILISIVSATLGLTLMLHFIFRCLKKGREKQASGSILGQKLFKVSYERLLKATDGFSPTHLIGVGSFGSVYKGILGEDETIVAVKVLNLQRQGAFKSFMAECKALRNIRHRNLVKVITSCSSIDFQGNDFKAIVYEYMANGSLEKWLHQKPNIEEEQLGIQNLTLFQRLNIAIDVAYAVDYLHYHCQDPILHCDLKPSNILLDSDMTAHVGDFGLARFCPKVSNQNESNSFGIRGTIGYTAPEYGLGGEVSTNGDVYSYGILLLEMVTRKKPTDLMFEGDFNLHNFARMALPDRVMEIVDPILIHEEVTASNDRTSQARNNSIKECLISMVRIGVACSMESPRDRMSITLAINELESARKIILQPTTTRFN